MKSDEDKDMRLRRAAVAIAVLAGLTLLPFSAMAAPEELNDRAKSNIRVVIDFLRMVGNNGEADNIQKWLDAGKINMDEDLGKDTVAETDSEENITIKKQEVTANDLTQGFPFASFAGAAGLAALLIHEKVHAHQPPKHFVEKIAFELSLANDFDEMVAYFREVDLLADWLNWLIEEYTNEVRAYNPRVKAFNLHARAIAEGGEPDKATMRKLLDPIGDETHQLRTKKNNIINMILRVLGRAKTLKENNYEKEDYLYDRMKEKWHQYQKDWEDNRLILVENTKRVEDWYAWLERDPPPLPEGLRVLPQRAPVSTVEIEAAFQKAVALREAWERQADSDKVQHLMPFLELVAATLGTDGRINLRVYTDVTYRAYYNRIEQTLGIEVRNGAITGVALPGYATAEKTVWVLESAILRILIADDAAVKYNQELAAGHIRFEPEESALRRFPLILGVLLLLSLGALVVALRRRR